MTTTVRALFRLAGAPPRRTVAAVALGATTILCGVGLMATAGYLISRAAERPDVLALGVAIVGVRFFGLLRPIARYLERLASHNLALGVLGRVRSRVYERIEPLAPAELSAFRRGDLLARMVADVDALQNLHLRGAGPVLVAVVAGGVSVAVTAAFLPIAAVALACGLLAAGLGVPALTVSLGRHAARSQSGRRGALAADVVELLAGAPELAVYGHTGERLGRLRDDDAELASAARKAAFADGAGDGLRVLLTGATTAAVLAAAVAGHADHRLDRTLIAMLGLLALAAFEAVRPLSAASREFFGTIAAGRRVLELVEREPLIRDPERPAPAPVWPFRIELQDVAARYPESDARVLDGFSLRLDPGRTVALVGPSGGGKTTVANLLVRFLDPEQGRVVLQGRDLHAYRQEDVRGAVAVAQQDGHLFSATIRENVALGRPGVTEAEIETALSQVGLLEWVHALDGGLDTLVGEEGRELSGGQRQRIGVARALLAATPILVLDEPTAHLDPRAAERLIEDVIAARPGLSLLVITHRPEGLPRFDEVVTLGR
jgi:thiol reductant ABC exporter CydC subunit